MCDVFGIIDSIKSNIYLILVINQCVLYLIQLFLLKYKFMAN